MTLIKNRVNIQLCSNRCLGILQGQNFVILSSVMFHAFTGHVADGLSATIMTIHASIDSGRLPWKCLINECKEIFLHRPHFIRDNLLDDLDYVRHVLMPNINAACVMVVDKLLDKI